MAKWQRHSLDFKRQALAQELGIDRTLLYVWRWQLQGRQAANRADLSQSRQSAGEKKLREENRRLKEALGEKALEADFFVGALRRIEEQRRNSTESGERTSTLK